MNARRFGAGSTPTHDAQGEPLLRGHVEAGALPTNTDLDVDGIDRYLADIEADPCHRHCTDGYFKRGSEHRDNSNNLPPASRSTRPGVFGPGIAQGRPQPSAVLPNMVDDDPDNREVVAWRALRRPHRHTS